MEEFAMVIKAAFRLFLLFVCRLLGLSCEPEGPVLEYGVYWP